MRSMTTALRIAALVAGVLAGANAGAESDINLRGGFGYDSNAYELGDVLGEQGGFFADAEATINAEGTATGGWHKQADLGLSGRLHESSLRDADRGRIYVRARGDSAEKYEKNGWDWALRYAMRDQTYVSRLTGLVATDVVGNEIGDRYDSGRADLLLQWRFPGRKFGRFSIEATAADRNYLEDYEQFGLERLDYYEYGAGPGYEVGGLDRNLRVNLKMEERIYRDRRESDAAGQPVAGTDLEYRYYAVEARYQHRLTRRSALELTGGYDLREDSGVGYADRTQWNVGLEWTQQFRDSGRLKMEAEYSSRVFDQQVIGDPTINDEAPDKKGVNVQVRYARPFPFVDIRGFSLVVEAELDSYRNSDDERYTYDRLVGFIGVRQEF
jgi:hypothetical protein